MPGDGEPSAPVFLNVDDKQLVAAAMRRFASALTEACAAHAALKTLADRMRAPHWIPLAASGYGFLEWGALPVMRDLMSRWAAAAEAETK